MSTINGKACVANGRNLLTGASSDLKKMQLTNAYNVGPQATNGDFEIKVVKGQTYAYRSWLDNSQGTDQAFVNVRLLPMTEGAKHFSLADGVPIDKGETGYSTLVFTIPEDGYLLLTPFAYDTQTTASAGWKEEKLEKGSIATPWTPAPEDVM